MRKRALVVVAGVLIAIVGAVAGAGAATTTPARIAAANRSLAIRAANGLLAGLSLPSDAIRIAGEPAGDHGELAHSISTLFYAAEVDRARFWSTAAQPSRVISSIAAHLPAGAKSEGTGWAGGPELDAFASWSLPTIHPARLGQRLIGVQAARLAGGRTGVRADVWIQYLAPRLPAQRVPAAARVLEITVTQPPSGAVVQRLNVTDTRTVRRIAALIDGLPFLGGPRVPISCPAVLPANERLVTFRFGTSGAGPPLATLSLDAGTPGFATPCASASLWIRGHRQPPLANGGTFLKRAGTLLKVTLADTA